MFVRLNKLDLIKIAGDDDGDLATGATLFGAGAALNMGGTGNAFKEMHNKSLKEKFTTGASNAGKAAVRGAGKAWSATGGKIGKGMMGLGAIYGLRGLKRKLFDDD